MNRRQLTRALWSALAADPAGGIHAMQAGLLNAVEGWSSVDAGPAVDAVLAALVRLEVALDARTPAAPDESAEVGQ